MKRKGQVNIFSVIAGILVFLGIFVCLMTFQSDMFKYSNVTVSAGYNDTYNEAQLVVSDMTGNDTINSYESIFDTDTNISGGGSNNQDLTFGKAMSYAWNSVKTIPKAFGFFSVFLSGMQIPPVIIGIIITIIVLLISYVAISFFLGRNT